jgi:peptidoglycan/LPS O-acetylase OafA/YrhL
VGVLLPIPAGPVVLATIAAVLLAVLWTLVARRHVIAGASSWLNGHINATAHGSARDMLLLHGVDGLNSPLWSLQYEVLFSLLLPLYYYGAVKLPRANTLKAVALLLLMVASQRSGHRIGVAMPLFGLGALLALERERLGVLLRASWVWLAASLVLLLVPVWVTTGGQPSHPVDVYALAIGLSGVGATGFVALCVVHSPLAKFCNTTGVQWLGKRSFSLYLTHEPLVVSLALWWGGRPNIGLLLVASLIGGLALADLFYRLVEKPSHIFSRRISTTLRASERRQSSTIGGEPA